MGKYDNGTYDLYNDISTRTNGDIYIGVVGPVRTGKSTFIKRFMDVCVIPNIADENDKMRALDELPQSATGKTIMTTEPKFVPREATKIVLDKDCSVNIRLIDCVGYIVEGATGYIEDFKERMVKTPWFDEKIPFTEAAHIGTKKVITDHSTIGIVVTTDGSFGEIPVENYAEAENKVVNELKGLGKPFVVVLNTVFPHSKETKDRAQSMTEKYNVPVLPFNCEQLKEEDIMLILKSVLYQFPLSVINFDIPKWVELLQTDDEIMNELIGNARNVLNSVNTINDMLEMDISPKEAQFISNMSLDGMAMDKGVADVEIKVFDKYYYDTISRLTDTQISNEYELVKLLGELSMRKREFEQVSQAVKSVKETGYGYVTPAKSEIVLEEPELIKNGSKYGVSISAKAPSIHMINAEIKTQISPLVGSKEQAEDLISYIKQNAKSEEGMWDTNIFGKTIEQIVDSGIEDKIGNMSGENVDKIRDTLEKVMNDNNGLVCLIV